MRSFYDEFIQISLQQCSVKDYGDPRMVEKHNAAEKKLEALKREIIKNQGEAIFAELLLHENARVRLNAASCCISENIFTPQAHRALQAIIRTADDQSIRFAAKMLLR